MEKKINTITLEIKVTADKLSTGIEKLESFTRLVEKLSKEEECHGMTELGISAEIG